MGAQPLLAALLVGLAACGTTAEPEVPAVVDAASAVASAVALAEAAPATPAPAPLGEPVELVLVWQGIGALHKSFFSTPALTAALSAGMGGTVKGPANIYIRHDNEEFVGSIRLQLRPDTRILPVAISGDSVRLQDLAPITAALATYRSAVAGHFDFRVESFHVGIESFRGPHSCIFGLTGSPPPDGRVLSPCVQIDGVETCGTPTEEGVHFTPEAAKIVRSCLDL